MPLNQDDMFELNYEQLRETATAMKPTELAEEIDRYSALSRETFKQAGETIDLTKVDCLNDIKVEGDEQADNFKKLRAMSDKTSVYSEVLREKQKSKKIIEAFANAEGVEGTRDIGSFQRPPLDVGTMITTSNEYQECLAGGSFSGGGCSMILPAEATSQLIQDPQSAAFLRSAGFPAEVIRSGRVELLGRPEVRVVDALNVIPVTTSGYKYVQEVTAPTNVKARAEDGTFAESTSTLKDVTVNVESHGTYLPVSEEQLNDVPAASGYINMKLPQEVRIAMDNQLINGDGTAPNITGFLNTTGIQTTAKAASDKLLDVFLTGKMLIRKNAYAMADAVFVNPGDYERLAKQKDSQGRYLFGNPLGDMVQTIWGVRMIDADQIAENTALIGAFGMYAAMILREGVRVQIGLVNNDFIKNRVTIKADVRFCLAVFRPKAFCTLTALNTADS